MSAGERKDEGYRVGNGFSYTPSVDEKLDIERKHGTNRKAF